MEATQLTDSKEKLKREINLLEDELAIGNLLMYILGMKAQQAIGTNNRNLPTINIGGPAAIHNGPETSASA
jgi:hypothetical protein